MQDLTVAPGDLSLERPLAAPVAPINIRRLCLAGLAAIAVYLAVQSSLGIVRNHPDFEYFYKASRWLYDNGGMDRRYDIRADGTLEPRGSIEWYLPFVSRLFTNLTWMPFEAAGFTWLAINLAIFFATVRLLGRYFTSLPPQDWPVTQLVPVFVLMVFWWWEFRLNQINNLTMLLLVASFVHWRQGRANVSGLWLGIAILLKLTPAFLAFWFLLKRQYRVVAVAGLTFVLAGPVGSLIVFGPHQLADEYRTWKYEALEKGSHRGLILAGREMDWRNQSLGAVASRWLTPTNWNTHFDNDPRMEHRQDYQYLNVADWPRDRVLVLTLALALASVALLVWLARHPASRLGEWELRVEFALFMLAMLWLMPVMRRYHIIWALPTLCVLGAAIHYTPAGHWWRRLALAGVAAIFLSQFAMLTKELFNSFVAEAAGILLLGVFALALPLILLRVRLNRHGGMFPPKFLHAAPAGGQ